MLRIALLGALLLGGGPGDMGKPLSPSRLAVMPATAHTAVITTRADERAAERLIHAWKRV